MKSKIFVVYGMPRAGTTYLYHMLGKHPSIFIPYRKESLYFSANYSKGEAWFDSLYSDKRANQIGADVNPLYYLDDLAIARILKYDPAAKIVFGVRHPVSFARSMHKNLQALGWDAGTISDMCEKYSWQLSNSTEVEFSLVNGFLRNRVLQLQENFGDRLLIYDFAYFQQSPVPVLQAIEEFLSLPKYFDSGNVEDIVINASTRKNIPFLNWLLTQQRFLDIAYSITPRPVVRKLRSLFDRLSVSREKEVKTSALKDREMEKLQTILKEDTQFYEQLFAEGPLLFPACK